jgi:hypothetical protein
MNRFSYTLSAQKDEAPLIFVIAGTGSGHRSGKMRFLQRAFFGAGYHVVLLSSPTAPEFMLTASAEGVPGWMSADVRDLYEVMKRIRSDLEDELEISTFFLTGYSLGASQSAFLGELDQRERSFEFERILLINPAVSLLTSVEILDGLFEAGLPDGPASAEQLMTRLLGEISRYAREQRGAVLDSELLYRIAERRIAEGRGPPERRALQGLIGAAFRLSSANLVFTADVNQGGGHVIEAARPLARTTSLTVPFKRSVRWPFRRYLDDLLLPFGSDREPGLTREALVAAGAMTSIRAFLSAATHVGVITNADEIILTPEDLAFLRDAFGARATIFPSGGHCGNLRYHENVEAMLHFFEAPTGAARP